MSPGIGRKGTFFIDAVLCDHLKSNWKVGRREGMVGKGGIKLQPPKDSPTLRNGKKYGNI